VTGSVRWWALEAAARLPTAVGADASPADDDADASGRACCALVELLDARLPPSAAHGCAVVALRVADDGRERVLWTADGQGFCFSWALPDDSAARAAAAANTTAAVAQPGVAELVVHEGAVYKESARLKQFRLRWLVLTNAKLLTYRQERAYTTPTESIELSLCTAVRATDDALMAGRDRCSFTIQVPDRSFHFVCAGEQERDEWVAAICLRL